MYEAPFSSISIVLTTATRNIEAALLFFFTGVLIFTPDPSLDDGKPALGLALLPPLLPCAPADGDEASVGVDGDGKSLKAPLAGPGDRDRPLSAALPAPFLLLEEEEEVGTGLRSRPRLGAAAVEGDEAEEGAFGVGGGGGPSFVV